MQQIITTTACLFLLLFFFSCKKDNANNNSALMPLAIGNKWTYATASYYEDGTTVPYSDSEYTDSIISTNTINNNTYYLKGSTSTSGDVYLRNVDINTVESYFYNAVENYFKIVTVDSAIVREIRVPSCPSVIPVIGFKNTTSINGQDCYRNELLQKDCYGQLIRKTINYLKPGLGLVRQEAWKIKFNGPGLYLVYKADLKNYILK